MRVQVSSLILATAFIAACGPIPPSWRGDPLDREYTAEGVKLIAEGLMDGSDPATFGQESYLLSPRRNLLVRLELLSGRVESIRVNSQDRVQLKIRLKASMDPSVARRALRVCPLKRSWMMLATWERAHPFADSGRWASPGGEYESSECVPALPLAPSGANEPAQDPATVVFDVSDWFLNYPRGRGVNHGLVVLSDRELEVFGDKSGSYSPRLAWKE